METIRAQRAAFTFLYDREWHCDTSAFLFIAPAGILCRLLTVPLDTGKPAPISSLHRRVASAPPLCFAWPQGLTGRCFLQEWWTVPTTWIQC